MALKPDSHGKGDAQEMVGSRAYRPRRPLSDQRRYTTGGNNFPRNSQHDPGWFGREVARSLLARKQARRSIPHLESPPDSIRRRLRDYRHLERAIRKRGQTPGGKLHEGTRAAPLTRENSHHAHRRRI